MTPRERWLAILNHKKPDRLPTDYRATGEFTRKFLDHLGCRTLAEAHQRLHIDYIVDVGPRYVGPPVPPEKDVYGVGYAETAYEGGHYRNAVSHPLAQYRTVEEIEDNHQWPSPDWWDYSNIPDQIVGKEDQVIRGGHCEEFAQYKFMRGVARGYMDLVENPEMVHYCLGKLFDLQYERIRRIYEQIPGKVIWTWVAEDVSSQEGLMISLDYIKEFLIPHMKRIIDLVHEGGGYAFHHSDGACRESVPAMIEAGIDVLDPVQWRAKGMDREGLQRDFGEQLVFHGGMDNQYTLARGSLQEVKQEVVDNIRLLGARDNLILGPCHNIQVVSDPAKIAAMYETAYECGWR